MDRSKVFVNGVRLFGVGGVIAAVVGLAFAQTPPPPPPPVGAPLPGLTPAELSAWQTGLNTFLKQEQPTDGLGPVFNARACAACHRAGAPGGASTDLTQSRVTRIGGFVNGVYSDLSNIGGPVIEAHSLREIDPNYPFPGEHVPAGVQFVSHRMTTPTFGDGLIELIPWQTLRDLSNTPQPDGIHGLPNWVKNPETGGWEIGRFGWKGQVSTLHVFAGDAFLNEMGITSKSFPSDNAPQGNPDPSGEDKVNDPEDASNQVNQVMTFMRFTAPPPPVGFTQAALHGQQLFINMNCSSCHTPMMQTNPNASVALSQKQVRLYSDLLLHHMGSALADGIRQGSAGGDQWKTAPLWGLRFRRFFLHDGRATTVDQAIMQHGGEATAARNRYANLSLTDKQAILDFLGRI